MYLHRSLKRYTCRVCGGQLGLGRASRWWSRPFWCGTLFGCHGQPCTYCFIRRAETSVWVPLWFGRRLLPGRWQTSSSYGILSGMRYLWKGWFNGWTGGKNQVFHSQRGRYWAGPKVANNPTFHINRAFKGFARFLQTPESGTRSLILQLNATIMNKSMVKMRNKLNHSPTIKRREFRQELSTLPPGGLILFLTDWLRPLTEGWGFTKGGEKTAAMAA